MTVYVTIGNTDHKLSQRQWSAFWAKVDAVLRSYALEVHGAWLSASSSEHQNACWCIVMLERDATQLRADLVDVAGQFNQDSIAWAAVPSVEMLSPARRRA